jgi:hypothetical protein
VASGGRPKTARWRWWDVISLETSVKDAILSLWVDWALPRPELPVKAFRESFL